MTSKHISQTIGDDADDGAGGFQQHKSLSEESTQQISNTVWVENSADIVHYFFFPETIQFKVYSILVAMTIVGQISNITWVERSVDRMH